MLIPCERDLFRMWSRLQHQGVFSRVLYIKYLQSGNPCGFSVSRFSVHGFRQLLYATDFIVDSVEKEPLKRFLSFFFLQYIACVSPASGKGVI